MLLIREFKQAFESRNLSFTTSFTGKKNVLVQALDYAAIQKYVDFIQFSVEQIHPNSNITVDPQTETSISVLNYTTDTLMALGVNRMKIIIGIKTFCGFEKDITTLDNACITCRRNRNWKQIPSCVKIPDKISKIKKQCEFEPARSIANQIRFLMKQDIAGVMVYAINFYDYFLSPQLPIDTFEDFKPATGITLNIPQNNNEQYPLLQTVHYIQRNFSNKK